MTAFIVLFFILTVQAALAFDDPWRAADEENDDMMADPLGPSFASGAVIPRRPKVVKHKKITIMEHHPMPTFLKHHPMSTIIEHHSMPTIMEHHPVPTIIEHHPLHAAVIRRFFEPIPHTLHDQDLTDGMARKKRSVPYEMQ